MSFMSHRGESSVESPTWKSRARLYRRKGEKGGQRRTWHRHDRLWRSETFSTTVKNLPASTPSSRARLYQAGDIGLSMTGLRHGFHSEETAFLAGLESPGSLTCLGGRYLGSGVF